VIVRTPDGLIGWANETFVSMFGLPHRQAAVGQTLEQVYRDTWSDAPNLTHFDAGRLALAAGLRRPGAPFELPMPIDRWLRVTVQTDSESRSFFTLVDITELKRQQQALAEKTAQLEALLAQQQRPAPSS
jgi:PAS domain-containing protein